MKFKRVNIHSYAINLGVRLCLVDLLKQSSVEMLVNFIDSEGGNKQDAINIIQTNIGVLLNKMIVDDEENK